MVQRPTGLEKSINMFLKSLLLSLTMCLVVQMTFAQGSSDISIIDGNVILKTNDLTGYGNLSPEDLKNILMVLSI